MLTHLIRIVVLAGAGAVVAGCASSYPNNYGLTADKALLVRQICNDIMGLKAGPEFMACTSSIAETVQAIQEAELLAQADRACAQRGVAMGAPDSSSQTFAQCVVMLTTAASGSAAATPRDALASTGSVAHTTNVTSSAIESLPRKFYFHMTQSEKDERAQLSCAQLGLHPAWGSFRQCVFNLQYAIVDVRYSSH